ncbi:MAG: hypothetical protein D3910_21520, partial [Candidatus Electrothrix sp. ATG2]|nr:hypothetical protein [Candidatus Electrothrix sp. ATG2]
FGSEAIETMTVSYIGEGKEHSDKYIPGINREERAPDYGIRVRTHNGWKTIGVKQNTFIGDKNITFHPSGIFPVRLVYEIEIFDQDKIENDILDRVPFSQGIINGQNYRFATTTTKSLEAGLVYFGETRLGKGIFITFFFILLLPIIVLLLPFLEAFS